MSGYGYETLVIMTTNICAISFNNNKNSAYMSYNTSMINIEQQMPGEIAQSLAQRLRARRKEYGLTQEQLAQKAGVSLGSLKRFEQEGQISLVSLIKLSTALGSESDFDGLFSKRGYRSIQEVIDGK